MGVGGNSFDHVAVIDKFPRLGGKNAIRGYREHTGGQVATGVLLCARLGLRAAYLGSVGDDAAGQAVLAPLHEAGVDLKAVVVAPGAQTRRAVILVDAWSGERTVLGYRDPRLALPIERLDSGPIDAALALLIDAEDPDASLWAARTARAAGAAVVLDVDVPGADIAPLLPYVDFPIVSRGFAEALSGTGSLRDALRRLAEDGARLPVITLGEQGALALCGDETLRSPAFPVKVTDTTGAGDAFHGAFLWGLLEGWGAEAVLRAANAAAAMNCRAFGAQGGLPTRRELEAFLRSHEPGPWRGPEEA